MIDHLFGRPNPSWKRTQVFLVIIFWLWRILYGNAGAPRILWLRRINRSLSRYTPWQLIVSTLCGVYATRNLDRILGLGSPEPLARLYSPSYYRATWIATGLDAGFATAMSIRPKWMRDLCSVLFSVYYIIYANEADEKLRKFRAVPTVEMLRTTWEKTTNPYIRVFTHRHLPRMSIRRKILLPRPKTSSYQRPITAYLYFALPEHQLCKATDLILDFPGGGFVAMTPEHHEERLRMWAWRTGRPVLSIDYGKAPEYPYPFAIDEAFDTYRVLVESKGVLMGMSGKKLNIVMSGDSAGATLAVNVVIKILEHNSSLSPSSASSPLLLLPQPVAVVLNYAALDFNFTSWMSPDNLRVLRSEQSSGNLPGLRELATQKDHLSHVSPLSMAGDRRSRSGSQSERKSLRRKRSWRDTLRGFAGSDKEQEKEAKPKLKRHSTTTLRSAFRRTRVSMRASDGEDADAESEEDDADFDHVKEEDRPIQARVRYVYPNGSSKPVRVLPSISTLEKQQEQLSAALAAEDSKAVSVKERGKGKANEPIGTRLTMTSRTGYFQDRIVSPSMMRAMAILYIGPHRDPDFTTDYHISPILTPSHLLAQFPPLLMQCGEKDPFVDDTVIFAGRVREAKRVRRAELDMAIAGKSARFGENLRMSATEVGALDPERLAAMRAERDKLAVESEDDWVQMVLFSDWSHGYLQMPSLMKEAAACIEALAEWIDDAFESHPEAHAATTTQISAVDSRPSPFTSETETEDAGITFMTKKERSRTSVSFKDRHSAGLLSPKGGRLVGSRSSSGSDNTLRDDEPDANMVALTAADPTTSSADPAGLRILEGDITPALGKANSTPSKTATAGGTGQTITESELMRRRRLLDSHIFE
ncbi:hypothetical protein PLICRDRAFT_155534 [Plicaturopsis crispa FD-325 SS-3]|nr:hypothetical protein PLICRDRAFT_155534 [Plicaturopsis crispa FD-325 SS-3]